MKRIVSIWVLLLAVPAAAAWPVNVSFGMGWGGCYRPMEWTPVELTLVSTLKENVDAQIRLSVDQDSLNELNIYHDSVLLPKSPRYVPLVTKVAFAADSCKISIQSQKKGLLYYGDKPIYDYSTSSMQLTQVDQWDTLIGVVRRPGVRTFGLKEFPQRTQSSNATRYGKVYVREKALSQLPMDWTGYVSLDALVLYDLDLNILRPEQCSAIAEWVRRGGSVMMILGSLPLPADNPLTQLLPVTVQADRKVTIPWATLRQWGASGDLETQQSVRPLVDIPAGWRAETFGTDHTLYAHGKVGFGRVGVLGLNPAFVKGQQRENLAQFWIARFRPLILMRTLEYGTPQEPDYYYGSWGLEYEQGSEAQGSEAVLDYLYDIEELKPLSIWWVIGLLLALGVLLGPIDYLLLRSIGKLPWTWVTSVVIVVGFSAAAYYGVRMIRAGSGQVRLVSVVDGVADSTDGKGMHSAQRSCRTSFTGIFAPISDDYQLSDTHPRGWWSGLAPTSTGMMTSYEQTSASREIHCAQTGDGGNLPVSLPINIWSMQSLLDESPGELLPIAARAVHQGSQLGFDVENRCPNTIQGGYIRMANGRAVAFGEILPGDTLRVDGPVKVMGNWDSCLHAVPSYDRDQDAYYSGDESFSRPAYDFHPDMAMFARGTIRRTRAIERHLEDGGAVVVVFFRGSPPPARLASSSDYVHLEIVRLVLPAEAVRGDQRND